MWTQLRADGQEMFTKAGFDQNDRVLARDVSYGLLLFVKKGVQKWRSYVEVTDRWQEAPNSIRSRLHEGSSSKIKSVPGL
ncbi:hypothetical protein TNCT_207591 [Trichonephila clavata]|uniref:Uncharacterized protein n=1 Tax=Trichonephila clavata TaxID=2740835 RepID=A0A8X6HQL9_TRICU|nr:hypothetical protein TNCT_207591 [Trichonephila clavata]